MITHENPWLKSGEKLVCFGDSITAAKDGYVSLLAGALAAKDIEVVNAGRGGDKTPWALTRLQQDVIERKPDAVSIAFGANDAAVGRGCWADEPRVTPEAYRCNLVWIIHLCRLQGVKKFTVLPPLFRYEGEQYGEFGEGMLPYRQAARDAAEDAGARFAPVDIAFADEWARHPGHAGLLLTRDGVHPTAEGHDLIRKTLLDAWGLSG